MDKNTARQLTFNKDSVNWNLNNHCKAWTHKKKENDKDQKHIRKQIRKNPNITLPFKYSLKAVSIIGQR